jgi:2-polyprenyl-3-methyl-5-hydroxy-6-metoxy-1,4-benzoquinol methylase
VYCISVLEHIATFEKTVAEIARMLKPGGLLVLTIDLDPSGKMPIRPENYHRLIAALKVYFEYVYPAQTVHPGDLLRPLLGPCPQKKLVLAQRIRFAVENAAKYLRGKNTFALLQYELVVEGLVMKKK